LSLTDALPQTQPFPRPDPVSSSQNASAASPFF
jgi:hypothetical protein